MSDLTERIVNHDCWEGAREVSSDSYNQRNTITPSWIDSRSDKPDQQQQLARLVCTIEWEIIPRLMLAHRAASSHSPVPARDRQVPNQQNVVEFARLVLAPDISVASSYIAAMRARGTTSEAIYLDLLAPTARHLGDLWAADLCDFMEVTLGLWRLHQMLHELSPDFQNEIAHRAHDRRALLAPVPGEQHVFGIFMVAEFFRREGWEVWDGFPASNEDLAEIVSREWFDVIGFSLSCENRLEALTSAIRTLHRTSRNPAVGVLVGGPVFVEHPELVALVGADATALDGRQAALQAQYLLTLLVRPS